MSKNENQDPNQTLNQNLAESRHHHYREEMYCPMMYEPQMMPYQMYPSQVSPAQTMPTQTMPYSMDYKGKCRCEDHMMYRDDDINDDNIIDNEFRQYYPRTYYYPYYPYYPYYHYHR